MTAPDYEAVTQRARRSTSLLLLSFAACSLVGPDRHEMGLLVRSQAAGLSLVAPPGWHMATPQEVEANIDRFRLDDQTVEMLRASAKRPGFLLTKYPMPHDSVNPSVGVAVAPVPGGTDLTPQQRLHLAAVRMAETTLDFELVDAVQATELSGLQAAYMKATYRRPLWDGNVVNMQGRVWLVQRRDVVVVIAMSGAQEGPEVEEETFAAVQRTITIRP